MAPKKRSKAEEPEDDDDDVEVVALDDDDDDYGAGGKGAKKKAPAAKRPKKVAPPAAATVDQLGWNIEPPSLIFKDFGTQPNKKIAAFDLDGTLVNVQSGRQFPQNENDWKLFNKKVPQVIKAHHDAGYKIVIFSNQGGIKSALTGKAAANAKGRIGHVVAALGVPVQAFMATLDDDFRKPNRGMWDFMAAKCNGDIAPDPKLSFFVGDAAGRPADFASTDKGFAEGIGLPFRTPEDEFGEMDGKKQLERGAVTAKAADAVAGDSPNATLIQIFQDLSKANYDGGNVFKGVALKKVANVLALFPDKVSLSNLKEVGKLAGVGKGSLAVMKEFLETGKVEGLNQDGTTAAGGGAGGSGGAGAGGGPKVARPGDDVALKFM